jgi:UDP-N-acetylmuramyl tripeptide synthase
VLNLPRHGPLPPESAIDWSSAARIPIGLVTGTNGKTTTTRLVARIARAAGRRAGITSSDGVVVDEQVVQRGDFTGPEGARLVMRHPDVEIAILETARGGILRRGLTVDRCDAAVITNISADHLGDYGIDDVETMARVKAIVGRHAHTVILNADDPALVALAPTFSADVVWFGRTPRRGLAWTVDEGHLAHDGRPLVALAQIPITFGARASYNIENVLAASALAAALGFPDEAIVAGLRSFSATADDNPGRGTLVDHHGVSVLLDFGHNPVAIRGVLELARTLLAERDTGALYVTIGMPGDRLDDELRDVAREIAASAPTHVIVREMSTDLLRGRSPGEVPALLSAGLRARGVESISFAPNEVDALTQALSKARPGDLVVVLPHVEPAVDALLAQAVPRH